MLLKNVIFAAVNNNSVVTTNLWKEYFHFFDYQKIEHLNVNYFANFVDTDTIAHTNSIKNVCSHT